MNDVEGIPRSHPDAVRLSTILLKNTVNIHERMKEIGSGDEQKENLKFMIRN